LNLSEIRERIRALLIDEEFFDPVKWKIKMLCFAEFFEYGDHSWNEFDSVEFTADEPTSKRSICEFLRAVDD
jgi:hypothetical protein